MSNSAHYPAAADLGSAPPRTSSLTARRKFSTRVRGVPTTPVRNTADIKSFFDDCAASGFVEPHGHPQRLLEHRLALVRSHGRLRPSDVVLDLGCGTGHHLLALGCEIGRGIGIDVSPGMIDVARARLKASSWQSRLTFEVDDAEQLRSIASHSIDLAICIGAFEHMLDKQAVLASVYRVLKRNGRFVCLSPDADYLWYRTIAPLTGFATKHLSTDKFLNRNEFIGLLGQAGFRRVHFVPWTFISERRHAGDCGIAALRPGHHRALHSVGLSSRRPVRLCPQGGIPDGAKRNPGLGWAISNRSRIPLRSVRATPSC